MNSLKNPLKLIQNLVIPKPQDSKSLSFKPGRSRLIVFSCVPMLPAVDFDNQPCLQAHKIDNVGPKRMLAAKAQSRNLAPAQLLPKHPLRIRHGAP
jgi:hypothetical protein